MASQINYVCLVICLIWSTMLLDTCSAHVYGGRKVISMNNPQVQSLSQWAAKQLGGTCVAVIKAQEQVKITCLYEVFAEKRRYLSQWAAKQLGGTCISVTHAQEQVVSGLLYYIAFKMESSGKSYSCEIKVWLQPWKDRTELVQHRCIRQYSTDELTWNL